MARYGQPALIIVANKVPRCKTKVGNRCLIRHNSWRAPTAHGGVGAAAVEAGRTLCGQRQALGGELR